MARRFGALALAAVLLSLIVLTPVSAEEWKMYVVNEGNDTISVFDQTNTFLYSFAAVPPTSMRQIQIGSDGQVYVAAVHLDQSLQFDQNDTFVGAFGDVPAPAGLAVSSEGRLYLASGGFERTGKIYDESHAQIGEFSFGGTALAISEPNFFAAANNHDSLVHTGDLDGNLIRTFSTGAGSKPRGIAIGSDGLIYVARDLLNDIAVYDSSGSLRRTISGNGISDPYGLAFSPTGSLWVALFGTNELLELSSEGQLLSVINHDLSRPVHITFRAEPPCEDFDGDGYGFPGLDTCPGGVLDDCDDTNPDVFPGAGEVYDALDNNCDGLVDEGLDDDADGIPNSYDYCTETPAGSGVGPDGCTVCVVDPDEDGDGYPASMDCDDWDGSVNPGGAEVCNNIDDNCDSQIDEGFDQDGDGFTVCAEPTADCDDSDVAINANATELPGNADDENCDGSLGACDPTAEWTNHGQYVRCVAQEAEDLVAAGVINQEEGDALISAASQSNVGR